VPVVKIVPWDFEAEGVNSPHLPPISESSVGFPTLPLSESRWYAIQTVAKHEKHVVANLERQGIQTFLPLVNEIHQWSDRKKVVQLPLFSCYAFVNLPPVPEHQAKVMFTDGVLRFVGKRGEGTPIADTEIDNVRTVLKSTAKYFTCPFINIGQRVRVRGGSLDGIEGILIARNGSHSLVISVEPIQRSLAVSINDYKVEAI
jgi:transcription antitermination factor NusG